MTAYLRISIFFVLALCFFLGCVDEEPKDPVARLAEEHCTTCHKNVEPTMLTKKIWSSKVLPAMAVRMGIGVWQGDQYYDLNNGKVTISMQDWEKIVDYYVSHAPDSLLADSSSLTARSDWGIFQLKKPGNFDTTDFSTTTLVKFFLLKIIITMIDKNVHTMKWF